MVKKILLMGSSGAGKSSIATMLGTLLNAPVLHMDIISHDDKWNRLSPETVDPQIHSFLKQDSWIIDGQYRRYCYRERLDAADMIIFFDFHPITSLFRCLRRAYRTYHGKEKRYGALESHASTLRARFIHYLLWKYPRHIRTQSIQDLLSLRPEKVIFLRNQEESDAFFKDFLKQYKS